MKKAFPPFVNQDSKILILGTMPGEKSLQLNEYYGNKGNQFWRLLFTMLDMPVSHEYRDKLQLLEDYCIAVWDVLESCEREGSLDSKIKNECPNDFKSFYVKYPKIKHVFFSSKNAAAYYDNYVGRRNDISYYILPSPSGANATKSFKQKLEEWAEKIMPLIIK